MDRKIRIAAGVTGIVMFLVTKKLLLLILGGVLLFTGWKRSCMLYSLLKIDTTKGGGTKPPAA